MSLRSEQTTGTPTLAELKARQQMALQANMNKATNLQKSVMLTEDNWTGLIRAVELTGQSVLRLQEMAEHLMTSEQMDEKLSAQVSSLLAQHTQAVTEMRNAVEKLAAVSTESLEQMRQAMTDTVNRTARQMEAELKNFRSQVGRTREDLSTDISRARDTLDESASSMMWKMYLPTVILVLWELVRYLFLRG